MGFEFFVSVLPVVISPSPPTPFTFLGCTGHVYFTETKEEPAALALTLVFIVQSSVIFRNRVLGLGISKVLA